MNIDFAQTAKIKTDIASGEIPDNVVTFIENSIQDGINYAIKNGFYSVVVGIDYAKLGVNESIISKVYDTIEPQLIERGYTTTSCSTYENLVGSVVGGFDSVYIYPGELGDIIKNIDNEFMYDSYEYIDKINGNYKLILIEWDV